VPPVQEMFMETQYSRIITTDEIKDKIKLSIGKKRKLEAKKKYRNSEEVKQNKEIMKYFIEKPQKPNIEIRKMVKKRKSFKSQI